MGVLQGAEDLARIFMSSAMFNAPSHFGPHAGENAAKLEAARQRMGLAGDAVNGVGMIAGPTAGIGALRMAARAVPMAIGAAPQAIQAGRVALTNAGGYGITHAEALARLGIQPTPGIASRFGSAVISRPKTAAAAAIGVAGGTALSANDRIPSQAKAAVPKPPAPVTQSAAQKKPAENVPTKPAQGLNSLGAVGGLLQMVANQNGGRVPLQALQMIGPFAAQTQSDIRHPPTYKDLAAQQMMSVDQNLWNQGQMQVDALKQAGRRDEAIALQQQNLRERMQRLAPLIGGDPYAAGLGIPQPEDQ